MFMSIKTKLELFTLQIREKGNRDNYLELHDIAGFNLMDEFHNYLQKNIYLFKIDKETERTYRIDKNEYVDDSIFCRIKVGKFGETSEIIDTLSGSGVFHKEREHSDTIPLYFHIKESKEKNKAFIFIQRTNNRTLLPEIKNILLSLLNGLREDTFTFDIKPHGKNLSIKTFLKNEEGEVAKIILNIDNNLGYESLDKIKITLKPKTRKPIPTELINGVVKSTENKNIDNLSNVLPKELKMLNISGAEIELKSNKYGKLKYNIGEKLFLNSSFTIPTDKEFLDKSGHPAFNKLKEFSIGLLK